MRLPGGKNSVKDVVFYSSLFLGITLIFVGALTKIMHYNNADAILTAAFICAMVYTVIGVHEIFSSSKIAFAEKAMWLTGFLFLNFVTALSYILFRRKGIIETELV